MYVLDCTFIFACLILKNITIIFKNHFYSYIFEFFLFSIIYICGILLKLKVFFDISYKSIIIYLQILLVNLF